ncbi:MAG TPA: hypothetical protein VE544_08360 [Nitrososphaeraceae archaeon]|jgi:hypothetical protein|nr:hypothetical protein [Nitrososphaeraceae archaeon]
MIRTELRKILNIIVDKAENSTSKSVIDLAVIAESGLPESEARKYINELEGLQMITLGLRASGADIEGKPYRLINLTTKGLEALQDQNER